MKHVKVKDMALVVLCVLCASAVDFVGAQIPQITVIYPAGGQRGTTVNVTINGGNLANAKMILFSGTGVSAQITGNPNANTVTAAVSIAPDAPLGMREVRVTTNRGTSNGWRFAIGHLPEINEAEPNKDVKQGQRLAQMPVLINGQVNGGEDLDHFIFTAQQGQRFIFEVLGQKLIPYLQTNPGWFDPYIKVKDMQGRDLKEMDDWYHDPDPRMEFVAPAAGDYVLMISDSLFRGSGQFVYRLTVGPVPHVITPFPAGGQRGTTVKVNFIGYNLEGAADQQISIPADISVGTKDFLLNTPAGIVPYRFEVGDLPEFIESEPNDKIEQATPAAIPSTLNGRIDQKKDVDHFKFSAQAGQQMIFEMFGRRLGSPVDCFVQVLNAQGQVVAGEDINALDGRFGYTFPAAGDYFVRIKETTNMGGPEFVYRLTISPPQPDFNLVAYGPDSPNLSICAPTCGQGGSAVLQINLGRKDGFNGEVRIECPNLPQGVTFTPVTIGGTNTGLVTFTAAPDAPQGVYPITIVGSASINNQSIIRPAVPMERMIYVDEQTPRDLPKQTFFLTIVEPMPYTLSVSPNAVTVTQGQNVQLTVTATRNGFNGPIALQVQGLPQNVGAQQVNIPENQTQVTLQINAAGNAQVGTFNIVIRGLANNNQINIPSHAVTLTVQAAK